MTPTATEMRQGFQQIIIMISGNNVTVAERLTHRVIRVSEYGILSV